MTKDKTEVMAAMAEVEARYARYFQFLDELKPANATVGATTGPLAEKFGITDGEALSAWLHWRVTLPEGGSPEHRSKFLGGF
jgi:hypothetical protein